MNWIILVLIGGAANALSNYGYKTCGPKIGTFYLMSAVMAIGAIAMGIYGGITQPDTFTGLFHGYIPLIVMAMGLGMALVWIIMMRALLIGPLSLVDPLWACIYALGSIAIGMMAARENPSLVSLAGVALYLVGAVLMARGDRKKS